ncbi:MAG TPA: SLC13 family permease [Vicinamibacterales bacterium]|nr:SLC13 family permease [Vicinamibacterales bacterium]
MNPAVASLAALIVAIVLSMVTRINVGLVGLVMAWLVGAFVAGLPTGTINGGFPTSLFLTLAGMTLLFAAAESNGTIERLTRRAVSLARGSARSVPLFFFVVACVLSAIGPGAVSSVALVVPLAMAIGRELRVPAMLTALVVANGANAGNLSPISAVGVIANTRMAEAGLGGHEGLVMMTNLVASAIVAAVAYVLLGGWKLARAEVHPASIDDTALSGAHRLTMAVVAAWIAGVLFFDLPLGLSAFAGAVLLVAAGAADETDAVRRTPWGIILMVCGMTTLVALLEQTGGMDLFTALLSSVATPGTINGVIAFVTGAISLYSSTSGVVLPAFLPTVPGIVQQLGGGDPLAISLSINVGSSLVDVSPLSTLGALCVAAVADTGQGHVLFRQLLAWGLAMALVGAVLCQLGAGMLAGL